MLSFFPLLGWLAAVTTLVALIMLAIAGELRPRTGAAGVVLFLAAGYCQFFATSPGLAAAGLGVQTLLAISLIVRWRLSS
jgi:hypothetical protein